MAVVHTAKKQKSPEIQFLNRVHVNLVDIDGLQLLWGVVFAVLEGGKGFNIAGSHSRGSKTLKRNPPGIALVIAHCTDS